MNQLFGLQHRGDRHLGYSSRHTQVPVPATTHHNYENIFLSRYERFRRNFSNFAAK